MGKVDLDRVPDLCPMVRLEGAKVVDCLRGEDNGVAHGWLDYSQSETPPQGEAADPPNGLEMSRPASQAQYRMKWLTLAGRVGSIELLGGQDIRYLANSHLVAVPVKSLAQARPISGVTL